MTDLQRLCDTFNALGIVWELEHPEAIAFLREEVRGWERAALGVILGDRGQTKFYFTVAETFIGWQNIDNADEYIRPTEP